MEKIQNEVEKIMSNNSSKLNILHLCSWYPNRIDINGGNFIFRHIRIINNQTNSRVLSVYQDGNIKNKSSEIVRVNDDGVVGIVIYFRKCRFDLIKYFLIFFYYYKGYKILKKEVGKIDLIHSHVFVYSSFISWFISLTNKIPFIVTEHSSIFFKHVPFFLKYLLVKVSNRSKYILPVSDALGEKIKSLGISKNYVKVPNVVDTNIFYPAKSAKVDGKVKFLHISSFNEDKNISGILRTVKQLSQMRDDFVFTIAGDGDLNSVVELKKKYSIDDRYLKLYGKLEEDEVADLIRCNDVFVIFSNFETFSIVIAESLACGIPVITSDLPNVREFEDSGGIYTVEKGNEQSLLEAMIYMISHYKNYDKSQLHNFICEKFSNEVVANKLLSIYNSAIR